MCAEETLTSMALSTSLGQIVEILQSLQYAESEALLPDISSHILRASALAAMKVSGISTDSRKIRAGEIFLALKGETFDGHAFIEQAFEQGAIAAIVNQNSEAAQQAAFSPRPLLPVINTLKAYQAIAHWWRHQCSAKIIAVTGSVGKTTTKELIAAVLGQHGSVLKTEANYNNEIGVPKTLLELDFNHQFAVVEMGMRAVGEIAELTNIAKPDVAVITNVGTAHIGRLGSEEAIARAKCELLAKLPPGSIAVLNAEDHRLMHTAQQVWTGPCLTFGLTNGDLKGAFAIPNRLQVGETEFTLPLQGRHNAVNFMAALAVAEALNLDWTAASQSLTVELPQGRARQYWLSNNVLVLDETYNAGVESMTAALQLLANTPGKRHIAVLGTMKELGDRSTALHQRVGAVVQSLHLDYLLVLADLPESQALAEGAKPIPVERFTSADALAERLAGLVEAGDRLLFKASRAVGLERVIEQLKSRLSLHD